MNEVLNKWVGFPGWDTRADTNAPVNPRLPNSPLYTYDPQTGEAGFDTPREYNIPKVNPIVANNTVADPVKIVSDNDIVNSIIRGEYGNGDKRKQALMALGLTADDIERIRGLVNARMYAAQARPAKHRKPAAVPVSNTPRQGRTTYQGMPMNWVGPQDPDYIYVK